MERHGRTFAYKLNVLQIDRVFLKMELSRFYTTIREYLKIRHIFKSCNTFLKPERFYKSKFTLSKVKSE